MWFQKFRSGDFESDAAPRFGRSKAIGEDDLRATIAINRSLATGELAMKFNVCQTRGLETLYTSSVVISNRRKTQNLSVQDGKM